MLGVKSWYLHDRDVVFLLPGGGADGDGAAVAGRHTVDFEGLSFAQGGHLNTNKNTNLPPGSTRTTDKVPSISFNGRRIQCFYVRMHAAGLSPAILHRTGTATDGCQFWGAARLGLKLSSFVSQLCALRYAQGFEEIHVPALRQKPYASNEKDRAIADLPDWMQPAFKGMKSLNRIQSKVHQSLVTVAGHTGLSLACILFSWICSMIMTLIIGQTCDNDRVTAINLIHKAKIFPKCLSSCFGR